MSYATDKLIESLHNPIEESFYDKFVPNIEAARKTEVYAKVWDAIEQALSDLGQRVQSAVPEYDIDWLDDGNQEGTDRAMQALVDAYFMNYKE